MFLFKSISNICYQKSQIIVLVTSSISKKKFYENKEINYIAIVDAFSRTL